MPAQPVSRTGRVARVSMTAEVHPEVAPLRLLLGRWTGEGEGEYATIEAFSYREEVTFGHVGKPFLSYAQRTSHRDDGRPLHAEAGYWRMAGRGRVELVLAHPSGIVEVEEGEIDGARIELATTVLGHTTTAKEVRRLERVFEVAGDVLRYEVRMAAVGQPLQGHLRAELRRT